MFLLVRFAAIRFGKHRDLSDSGESSLACGNQCGVFGCGKSNMQSRLDWHAIVRHMLLLCPYRRYMHHASYNIHCSKCLQYAIKDVSDFNQAHEWASVNVCMYLWDMRMQLCSVCMPYTYAFINLALYYTLYRSLSPFILHITHKPLIPKSIHLRTSTQPIYACNNIMLFTLLIISHFAHTKYPYQKSLAWYHPLALHYHAYTTYLCIVRFDSARSVPAGKQHSTRSV